MGITIQSALDIEKAAAVASQTPMPSGYIKNTGADLPEQQVNGFYKDVELGEPTLKEDEIKKKEQQLEGIRVEKQDDIYTLLECHVNLDLEGFEDKDPQTGEPTGIKLPYVVTIEESSREVLYYTVDGAKVPMVGVGSLVTFQGLTQGVLQTAGRTIQSALDLEKASAVASQTPMATGFIKNTGADMPESQVQALLAAWKSARQNKATAYLTSTLSYETVGYSPKDMMYSEAQQYLATQIAP